MSRGRIPHPSVEERRPPEAVLPEHAAARVAELVPNRHGRMHASPLAFLRGAAALMAADLAETPRSGLPVQLCGDAHLSNFGGFASPDRELVFDINDFDETARGPWEWDVKRLAASIAIAAYLGSGKSLDRAIAAFAETYADQNERDHAALKEAAHAGRIAAERGV